MIENNKLIIAPILISLIAVVLSQTKPIYTFFEDAKIDILVGKKANVYEQWGNVAINFFIQFINDGDAAGVVDRVSIFIKSKNSNYKEEFIGQSYFLQPTTIGQNEIVSQIPLSLITVKEASVWSGFINSYADVRKSEQKKIQDFAQEITTNIELQFKKFPGGNPQRPLPIDQGLLDRVVKFTRSNSTNIEVGEYELLVMVWLKGVSLPEQKKMFNFSIYESDVGRLRANEKNYVYGWGLVSPLVNSQQQLSSFQISLSPISDLVEKNRMYESYIKYKE